MAESCTSAWFRRVLRPSLNFGGVVTGGFDRDVLGVFTATGTGWINPNVSDALEYLYSGDTAEILMQYS